MATKDIGDGAIAGIVTGVIMGFLAILLALVGFASMVAFLDIRSILGGILPITGFAAASLTAMITVLLFLAIIGLVIGAVFGALYEEIPTVSSVTKGIVFLLAIWVVFGLLVPLVLKAGTAMPMALTAMGIVTALIAAVIWGGLLGLVFSWIAKRTTAPARAIVKT